MIALSSDQKIHESALAAHVDRQCVKDFANRCYWFRTIRENLLSEKLGIVSSIGMVRTIDAEASRRHEDLKLPDGRRLGDVKTHELASAFDKLRIPGFHHTMGRSEAILTYAEFVRPIYEAAGEKAVREWLENNRSD
jgi:hypothetical protein